MARKKKSSKPRRDLSQAHGSKPKEKKKLYEQIDDEIKVIRAQQRERRRAGIRLGPIQQAEADAAKIKYQHEKKENPLDMDEEEGEKEDAVERARRKKALNNQLEELNTGMNLKKEELRRAEEQQFYSHQDRLHSKLNSLSREYNSLDAKYKEKSRKLNHLKSELNLLQSQSAGAIAQEKTKSRILEESNILKNTHDEIERLTHYGKIMQRMADRLTNQRHSYEKTLRSFEEALKVRHGEIEEIKEMEAHVTHLKNEEENKLKRVASQCKERLDGWEGELSERRALAKQQEEMRNWLKQKQENALSGAIANQKAKEQAEEISKAMGNQSVKTKLRTVAGHVNAHEEAFRKIQMATGLTDEEEIVERYINREHYIQEIDDRIEKLREEVAEASERHNILKTKLNNTKYSGSSGSDFNRELIDNLTIRYDNGRRQEARSSKDLSKLSKIVVEIDQTLESLSKMLRPITIDDPKQQAEIPVSDGTPETEYVRRIEIIGMKVGKAIEALTNPFSLLSKKERQRVLIEGDNNELDEEQISKLSYLIEASVVDNANNIRIKPKDSEIQSLSTLEVEEDSEDEKLSELFVTEEEREKKKIKERLLKGKLRARALRLGKPVEEVEATYERIPHEHKNKSRNRTQLKKASLKLYKQMTKTKGGTNYNDNRIRKGRARQTQNRPSRGGKSGRSFPNINGKKSRPKKSRGFQ